MLASKPPLAGYGGEAGSWDGSYTERCPGILYVSHDAGFVLMKNIHGDRSNVGVVVVVVFETEPHLAQFV